MKDCLADPDVISFSLKSDSRAALYAAITSNYRVCISFVTVAELHRWPIVYKWGPFRTHGLEREILQFPVLPWDLNVCRRWADVMCTKGRPVSYHDAWIAATAIEYGIPV